MNILSFLTQYFAQWLHSVMVTYKNLIFITFFLSSKNKTFIMQNSPLPLHSFFIVVFTFNCCFIVATVHKIQYTDNCLQVAPGLTFTLMEPKVISLCHQCRAWSGSSNAQAGLADHCQVLTLISLKLIMDGAKYERLIISLQIFRLRDKYNY